jgi:hypothetical protein
VPSLSSGAVTGPLLRDRAHFRDLKKMRLNSSEKIAGGLDGDGRYYDMLPGRIASERTNGCRVARSGLAIRMTLVAETCARSRV